MVPEAVKKTLRKYRMLSRGDHVLVAVSGGPDSVCLLSLLSTLSTELRLTLHVAHLDHMFRGSESADEANFVRELSNTFNVASTIEQFDVPCFCTERGLSAQAGARDVRYGFFERVAGEVGASKIAVGHTATDQAETFIMRLLRGAGASGLSAIPPVRDAIIRPLIETTKEEIIEYLRHKELPFKSDPSNRKPVYTRNRIRLSIMPALTKLNPQVVRTLAAEAALLRDEDAAMEAYVTALSPSVVKQEQDAVAIGKEEFEALSPALKRRVLRKAVEAFGADPAEVSFFQIEDALSFMSAAQTGRTMHLPQGIVMEREYDRFVLRPPTGDRHFTVQLTIPGVTAVPDIAMETETWISDGLTAAPGDGNYLWQAQLDYDKIALPLFIRSRAAGDRFCPAGMGGKSKKLQDYFVDEKIPRLRRDTVPILATDRDIVWLVGFRTDERFLPGAKTTKVLTIGLRSLARSEESHTEALPGTEKKEAQGRQGEYSS